VAGAVTLVFRVFVALVVTLSAVSSALLVSATPVLAQEDPNTTRQAPAPSPERDRSSQPAPTDMVRVPAPTDTVTVPAVSVPAVGVPAPTDTVTVPAVSVPAPTDTTAERAEPGGDLVNALLVGKGSSSSLQGLMEHADIAAGDLVQEIGGMLSGLLGGDEGIPIPDNYYLSAQPLTAFYYDYEQATTELIERSAAAVGELAQAVGRVLSGSDGVAPNQAAVPSTPPAAPPPVPVAPPVAPVGYSSSLVVASGSALEAFQLLFAVLALFSVALLKGGRLSWLRRESHGPPTAVVLAIERPG
jgi:hypothetical protein